MKTFSISDLRNIQASQGYKYIGLFDQSGRIIINFNSNVNTSANRLNEIEKRLISDGLPDGYYIVKCKNTTSKTVATDDYTFYKGSAEPTTQPAVLPIQNLPPVTAEVLTYESALKMQVELERLKLQNAALEKELEQVKRERDEALETQLLSEEEANTPSLLESGKAFLSDLMGIGAPLLDKHFELKDKQLAIQAAKLQFEMNRQTPAVKKPSAEEIETEKIKSFISSYQDDQETYEALAGIFNSATGLNDFKNKMKEYNVELYTELYGN
jgi:hypothetical protein